MDHAVDVVGVLAHAPLHVVAQAQFRGQLDDGLLGLREVVVEFLDGIAGRLVDGGQPPEVVAGLEDADLVAALLQPIGRSQSGDAAADDANHTLAYPGPADLPCVFGLSPRGRGWSGSLPFCRHWKNSQAC